MNKKIYPKTGRLSRTTEDTFVGGNVPKRRTPRSGVKIWVYKLDPPRPPGWRPDALKP